MKKKINQLGCILQSLTKEDQLKYMPQYDIETKGQNNFSSYLCNQDNIEFACTLEVTYAGADDMKVTQDNLRAFGSRLGDALELYISK